MTFFKEIYDALTSAGLLVEEYGASDSDTFPQYQIRYQPRVFDDNATQFRRSLDVIGIVPEPFGDEQLEKAMNELADVLLGVRVVATITETLGATEVGSPDIDVEQDRYLASIFTVERVPG